MKKRCKKILLYGSMFMVMNILFAACTGKVEETVLPNPSPTATVTITPSPVSTQAAITIQPTKDLELTPSPTEEPMQHVTPMPSVTIMPTEVPTDVPTMTPTPNKVPTDVPMMTPTPVQIVTITPALQPSVTPTLIPSPTIFVTPTPAKDPLMLVYAGWQQVTDPSGRYMIVFPDMYDKVSLKQEAEFFRYVYTTSAMPDIKLELCFNMEESVELRQEKIVEQYPEVKVKPQTDGFAYYAETDTVFVAGEVYTWNYETVGMHGVMHIENIYPKEKKEEYQKEMYYWYVCVSKEE